MSSELLTPPVPNLSSGVFTDTTPRGVAVAVRGLSKSYRITKNAAKHTTAGEALMHKLRHPFEKTEQDTFWALNDVSFDIQKGDVVGIIGRNGAGKSTLLKILSRITEPTKGKIALYGRVGSLLEVGTGFHPELTGRENIYLNGAILGMTKGEIARQFDAIVDFSGTEQFLDTPVKRYSSGMYVRLAFAVAAHLNPEILIIDEVLAVGDAEFQKKCLGKMQDVANSGRTVLFVSHNLASLRGLCNTALLIKKGRLEETGTVDNVIKSYLSEITTAVQSNSQSHYRHRGSQISIDSVELYSDGVPVKSIQSGLPCSVRIRYHALNASALNSELSVSVELFSGGQRIVNLWTNARNGRGSQIEQNGVIDCLIPKWPFRSQLVRADVFTHIGSETQDWIEEALIFDSYDGDYYETGVITNPSQGIMFFDHSWNAYAAD